MGLTFLVQASLLSGSRCSITTNNNESYRSDKSDNTSSVWVKVRVAHPYGTEVPKHPPLDPLRTLALSVLIDPTTASTSALIDALKDAGVITEEWEGLVRADERERDVVRRMH